MYNSSSPLLFINRNLIIPLLISADKSLITLSQKSKLLEFLRQILVYVFYVVLHVIKSLRLLLPFNFSNNKTKDEFDIFQYNKCSIADSNNNSKQLVNNAVVMSNGRVSNVTNTGIARAINQLLTLIGEIPVSSRKYDVVRCLVEKLIDDNLKSDLDVLKKVNCVVLSDVFGRTLFGLESQLLGLENDVGFGLGRVVSMVKGWGGPKEGSGPCVGVNTVFAEKTAAELLWLAQKLVASGGEKEAVDKWAWASNLGWSALSADPRVQSSLVKLTAFLVKQAKEMSKQQQTDSEERERLKQTLLKMLTTWIPLLCQASNGTDTPTLSISDRGEVETALEELIDMLEDEESQEKVLFVWLHHFTQSPSSDWPNLYNSYIRWCTISRNHLVTL